MIYMFWWTEIYMFLTAFIHSSSPIRLWVVRKAVSFYFEWLLIPRPVHQAEEPPLVGFPQLNIQYIPIYPTYLKQLLHPKPEDALCRDDRTNLFTFMEEQRLRVFEIWVLRGVPKRNEIRE